MPRFFVEKITHPAGPVPRGIPPRRESPPAGARRPGDVFDLHESWSGEIESAAGTVTIRLLEKMPAPSIPRVVVAAAVPKGARLDWMVEKLAELGVAEFIPVRFARSVVEPGEGKRKRMEKIALAAAKQSGAPVMTISAEKAVGQLPADAWLASPGSAERPPAGGGCVVVGPEGGLTSEETRGSRAGSRSVPRSCGSKRRRSSRRRGSSHDEETGGLRPGAPRLHRDHHPGRAPWRPEGTLLYLAYHLAAAGLIALIVYAHDRFGGRFWTFCRYWYVLLPCAAAFREMHYLIPKVHSFDDHRFDFILRDLDRRWFGNVDGFFLSWPPSSWSFCTSATGSTSSRC
jgi:16S rRNA (uracil1498-N3)-methyltransferase